MQQIADWLEKLGMSEYAQRFAENRIDFSVLRELTDQDLKDLGVVLGDRRKMLRAIADIDGIDKNAPATPAKAAAAPRRTPIPSEPIPTTTPPPISAAAEAGGERRAVRCRRVARSRQRLSRCRLRRRDRDGRPCGLRRPATLAASVGDLPSSTIARMATRIFGVSRWSPGAPGSLRGRPRFRRRAPSAGDGAVV